MERRFRWMFIVVFSLSTGCVPSPSDQKPNLTAANDTPDAVAAAVKRVEELGGKIAFDADRIRSPSICSNIPRPIGMSNF